MSDKSENQKEADRILERVAQESETVGASSMRRVADRVKGHVGADDADQNNPIEIWGTRVGRSLGIIFAIFLLIYLVKTYVLHV